MSSGETDKTIKSDDEWKDRVRAEAEPLESASAPGPTADAPTASSSGRPARPKIDASQLPPANLTTLVSMLATQAMVALGILPDPGTGEADSQPALAKHFIDMLGVIETKTKENLTIDEQRMLNTTLHELRMAFVQVTSK